MIERILTIGAYGFDSDTFIDALTRSGVDLFVDVRARRGMRGAQYAFANARRLQNALARAGIRYVHAKALAPTESVRQAQRAADAACGVGKRQRTELGPEFRTAYERECLSAFDPLDFAQTALADSRHPVLFCVEREPGACHRSLAAHRLSSALTVPVENLLPASA